MTDDAVCDVAIIGSGPAGYTAAIYAARANLAPVLFEGPQPGGQLTITTDVENFPGFPEGVLGPELMKRMRDQAERFGCEIHSELISEASLSGGSPFLLRSSKREIRAKTVIVATGATARLLGLPAEDQFMGHGLSACATCDGFFFRGKEVMVIGGGDSALEEAMFLTRFATKVKVVHRRDALRASKIMQDRAMKNEKIEWIWNSTVSAYLGQPGMKLEGVKLKDTQSGEERDEKIDGVFLGIGHVPNTQIFEGQLEMDDKGYLVTQPDGTASNIDGVFACGDVQDQIWRQAITAAGTGCMAALEAERWLEAQEG